MYITRNTAGRHRSHSEQDAVDGRTRSGLRKCVRAPPKSRLSALSRVSRFTKAEQNAGTFLCVGFEKNLSELMHGGLVIVGQPPAPARGADWRAREA